MRDSEARRKLRSPETLTRFDVADCDQAIHSRFEQHAARRTDAVAIRLFSGDVTYGQGRPLPAAARGLRCGSAVHRQRVRFRNVTESLLRAAKHYTPRPCAGTVTLFRARENDAIFLVGPALGWSGQVDDLEIREVPGHHGTLLAQPHVRTLALELKECLEDASA